jgi:hypothetical protein
MVKTSGVSISDIPPDCIATILSFLNIQECLRFGSTSLSSICDIIPDLDRRRKRMNQRFYWSPLSPHRVSIYSKSVKSPHKDEKYSIHCSTNLGKIYVLPTVRERVENLYKSIPSQHPLNGQVHELLLDIRNNEYEKPKYDYEKSEKRDVLMDGNDINFRKNMSFSTALKEVKKIVKSHKLHSKILTAAITSDPPHYERYFSATQNSRVARISDPTKLNVTLERYIGDVLVAYFLMGHSVSGIVEGAPITKEKNWIQKIMQEIKNDEGWPRFSRLHSISPHHSSSLRISTGAWYRAWVFLHSTILRTAPFSRQHVLALGIAPKCIDPSFFEQDDSDTLMTPHLPFTGMNKYKVMTQFSQHPRFESLKITSIDFGVLGPTYRGRDRVQSQVIQPMTAIGVLVAFDGLDASSSVFDSKYQHNSILEEWVTGRDPSIRWILDVHGEAAKSRPVNVLPPLVTISSNC